MNRILYFSFLLLAACNSAEKPAPPRPRPVAAFRHGEGFNTGIDSTLQAYYALSEAFVNWDSLQIPAAATRLNNKITNLMTTGLPMEKNLPAGKAADKLYKAGMAINEIQATKDITTQRHAFTSATRNLFEFLHTVQYYGSPVYLQACPMAFNDQDSGFWLSRVPDIRNPYLGLHHPTYGKAMLSCGDLEDSVDFQPAK